MPNFSKLLANYPFHFIAGLGAVGAAGAYATTRYRDNGTRAGMVMRSGGRALGGGLMMGGLGAAAVGAGRYGTAWSRAGKGAASRLARRDWSAAKSIIKGLRG